MLVTALSAARGEDDAAVKWSKAAMQTSPVGDVRFHGPFSNEVVSATRSGLGAHDFLEISCDLIIVQSWDGSVDMGSDGQPTPLGPDFFRLGLHGGPTLLYTTFSNTDAPGFRRESRFQNYPSQVPGDRLKAQVGAREASTLGYLFFGDAPTHPPMDATYHLDFIIPHHDTQAVVEFEASNLQEIADESWGISQLQIRGLNASEVHAPNLDALSAAFDRAVDPKSESQPEAFQTLILGMETTIAWIEINVTPQPIDGTNELPRLFKNLALDVQHRDQRDAAFDNLAQLGWQLEPYLRDARKSATGEQLQRMDWLLQSISVRPIANDDLRRVLLASRVLEIIGTPRALAVRKHLTEK